MSLFDDDVSKKKKKSKPKPPPPPAKKVIPKSAAEKDLERAVQLFKDNDMI